MTMPTLHYIYHPLCGWCYAASPLIRAVAEAGTAIVLHGGGLFDAPTQVDAGTRAHIRQSDARIAQMAGVAFGPGYLDGLLMDPNALFWSHPVIAAILAAGAIEPGADIRMLAAVQHAHYVEGRRVVEDAVLGEVAATAGFSSAAFAQAAAAAPVDTHIAASRRLMQRAGVQGFPAFLIERDGNLARTDHQSFYGRPGAFVRAIEGAR